MRAYILGISDEIEVATIVYDEAMILAVKGRSHCHFNQVAHFTRFRRRFGCTELASRVAMQNNLFLLCAVCDDVT